MNPRSLVILLVLALGLGGFAYYVSQSETPGGNEVQQEGGTLLSRLAGDPERIRLTNKDGNKHYVLESGARGWMLVDPVRDEAQDSQVRMLLGQLAQATTRIAWPDGEETPKRVEESGLAEPLGRVVVEAGDQKLELEFGAECFPVGWRFARVNGKIHRIPAGIEGIVETNQHELINQMLFKTTPPGLQRLELRRRTENGTEDGVVLERTRGGSLTVRQLEDGAEAMPAAGDKVAQLVVELLSARVDRFLRRRKVPAGNPVPKPWVTIRVKGEFGEELVTLSDPAAGAVEVLKSYPKDPSFAERPSRMMVAASAFKRFVEEPLDGLISTQVWSYGPAAASSIRIEASSGAQKQAALVLARKGETGDFSIKSPQQRPAKASAITALMVALEEMRLAELLPPGDAAATAALAVPEYRVVLEAPRAKQSLGQVDVKIGVHEDGRLFLSRKGDSALWRVECEKLDLLGKPWWDYLEPVAFRIASSTRVVSSIAISTATKRFLWTPGEKGWSRDGKLDEDFEEQVFEALRVLKSKAVAGSPPQSVLAGVTPLATIRLLSSAGSRAEATIDALSLYAEGSEGLLTVRKDGVVVHRLFKRQARAMRRFLAGLK